MSNESSVPDYLFHYVCFACRKAIKQAPWTSLAPDEQPRLATMREVKCPQCGQVALSLGRKFKTPPRHDLRAWSNLELLCRNGWRGYGWPVRPSMSRRAIEAFLASRPQLERIQKQQCAQQNQQEKWRKMRRWPHLHP